MRRHATDAMDGKLSSHRISPLRRMMRRFGAMREERAFTLVELMLVVVLMTIFFSLGQGSTKSMDKQLIFMREQNKIMTKIYEMRSKVLASYADATACGFGIGITDRRLFMIRQEPEGGACRPAYGDSEITGVEIGDIPLEGVTISDSNFGALLFVPPHLEVAYNYLPGESGGACFTIENASDTNIRGAIKVNRTGQVMTAESCN